MIGTALVLWLASRSGKRYLRSGWIKAGTFRQRGQRVFMDVGHWERAVVVDLTGERYARVIVEVDEPDAAVAAIGAHLSRGTPGGRA